MRWVYRVLICLLLWTVPLLAEDKDKSRRFEPVDQVIEQAIAAKQIPGAVLLVGHNGEVVYRRAYGMRALEPAREPMTVDTIFDAASLTKPVVTATCMMKLVQLGKVRLADAVSKYIPEFGKNGKEEITIRQLLTHFSGLRPDLDLKDPWSGKQAAFDLIAAEKSVNPPGTTFVYSDINFEILGLLVERVAGVPLEKYAEEVVFKPLEMEHTRFLPPRDWVPRIAPTEYDEKNQMLRGVVHDPTARRMGGVAGHAGMFTTADDLARFAQAILDRDKFLTPPLIEKMTTPQTPPWSTFIRGFGWDIDTQWANNRGELFPIGSFGHTGFTGTSLWIDPYSKTYVILMTNAVHPRNTGDTWGKVAIRGKLANAIVGALGLTFDGKDQPGRLAITGYNEAAAGARRPFARNGKVLNGVDVLVQQGFKPLSGKRIGILTNQTGLTLDGQRTIDVLTNAPRVKVVSIFSPEHGVQGALDTTQISDSKDPGTGIPIYSVYGSTPQSRRPTAAALGDIDALVIDIQDIGARFYTYEASTLYFLEECAKAGKEVFILDRPNPISGTLVQGPVSDTKETFVNYAQLPARHGMTLGELAKMLNVERNINAKLTVIAIQGWQRGDWFDSTGQLWVNMSPNMRSLNEATLYSGVALIEGTNVSVGRGTDTPFEVVGAKWISASKAREFADYLNGRQITGVRFVPRTFLPSTGPYANEVCGGVNILITDRYALDAPEMGVELASALVRFFPDDYKPQRMVELLGHQQSFDMLLAGADPRRIWEEWQDGLERFRQVRSKYLIYK